MIAAHTSLDKARGGMADVIAELLDLEAVVPLAPAAADVLKLVGFVPVDDADLVRKALFAAGAGVIGEYEHCSWSVGGQGTFFGRETTHPAAGMSGRDETVDELRIEVVFPRRLRRRVTSTYVAAHPYEEPAFDLIPLENEIATLGLGRLGALPAPTSLAALAAEVAAVLRLPSVRYSGDGRPRGAPRRRAARLGRRGHRPRRRPGRRRAHHRRRQVPRGARGAGPGPGPDRRAARRHRAGGRAALGRAAGGRARPGGVRRDLPQRGRDRLERRRRAGVVRFADAPAPEARSAAPDENARRRRRRRTSASTR